MSGLCLWINYHTVDKKTKKVKIFVFFEKIKRENLATASRMFVTWVSVSVANIETFSLLTRGYFSFVFFWKLFFITWFLLLRALNRSNNSTTLRSEWLLAFSSLSLHNQVINHVAKIISAMLPEWHILFINWFFRLSLVVANGTVSAKSARKHANLHNFQLIRQFMWTLN